MKKHQHWQIFYHSSDEDVRSFILSAIDDKFNKDVVEDRLDNWLDCVKKQRLYELEKGL